MDLVTLALAKKYTDDEMEAVGNITIDDDTPSDAKVYSSEKVTEVFASKKKSVDSTLYDYTSLALGGRSKSKLIYNPHLIKAGQTIKKVTVKHGSNVDYSMTLVVGTISGSTLTPVWTKDFTYTSGSVSTSVDVNYTANAECVVGLYGVDPCGPPYSTAESGGCMCTKDGDTYTIASTGNAWVGTFKVEVSDIYDAIYSNDVSTLVGSSAQITVAQDGSGDVTTICEAVTLVSAERNIIYVKNGTYEEEVNLSSVTFPVWLIGEDRDLTILKSALANYSTPPLYHSFGGVKNMTIIAYNDGVHTLTETAGAYAIHADHSYSGATGYVVDNCHLISYWNAALGVGLKQNYTSEVRNSTLESLNTRTLQSSAGALIVHNLNGSDKSGQAFICENCTLYASHNNVAMKIQDLESASGSLDITFKNVSLFNPNSGNGNDAINVTTQTAGSAWQNTACVTLNGLSFGNSAPMLNYTT